MDTPPTEDATGTAVEDEAFAVLRDVIGGWLVACQLNGTAPLVSASALFQVLYDVIEQSMGRGAVRTALLMVFEKSHEQPMTFSERAKAKEALDQISNARRMVEGKPHLIMPGAPEGPNG